MHKLTPKTISRPSSSALEIYSRVMLRKQELDSQTGVCVSETWLHDRIPTTMIYIPGYKCYRKDITLGRGGGILVYITDHFNTKEIDLD